MYDTRIARFWGVDPLTKDYPMLTPFQFASNTPIWGVDIDGLEVRVYLEAPQYYKGNVGHVFLSVGKGKDIVVYSYGRYGALEKGKGKLNFTNVRGEGVLRRLTGDAATNFIKSNLFDNSVRVFEIGDANENKIKKFFDNSFFNSGIPASEGKYTNDPTAKVIDSYDLFSNNCTTKTIEAISISGSKEDFKTSKVIFVPYSWLGMGSSSTVKESIYSPADALEYLNEHAKDGDNVRDMTKTLKDEYENK